MIGRREGLRLRLLDLLDLLIDAAIDDDDLDEALCLLTRAIEAGSPDRPLKVRLASASWTVDVR